MMGALAQGDGVKLALASTAAGVALLVGLFVSTSTSNTKSAPDFDDLGDFPAVTVCRQPFGDMSVCGPVS